jgi:divalent metal cation (Fe/Co/Zn/Cd) transporter
VVAFLIASRFRDRPPNLSFPWGHHRVVSLAYLAAAAALLLRGAFVLVDSILTLLAGERSELGTTSIFGIKVWSGWLQLAALAAIIPPSDLRRPRRGLR